MKSVGEKKDLINKLSTDQLTALAANVKRLQKEKGWDVQDLAFYAMLSEKTIYNVLNELNNINLKTINHLGVAFEVPPLSLLVESCPG